MNKDSLIDFFGFIIVRIFSILFCCIPLRIALWIGRRGGDLAYILNSKRRSIAYSNLKAAFPEKTRREIKRITRTHFENIGMSVVELLKAPLMDKKYLERHISVENVDRIKEALDRGKGVMFLSAHFGNWELASLAVSSKGYRMSLFAREQKHKRLNSLLDKYREMTGCRVVTKGFSVREIIRTLNNNGIVAVLGDQDAGPNGVFVDFLNRPASTAPGAIIFSLRTGALILPSFMRRTDYDKHILEICKPLEIINTQDEEKDIKINLQKISHILETHIKNFPEQWLWSHKRWKTTPQRTVLVLSDGKPGHLNQAVAVAEMVGDALKLRLQDRGIKEKAIIKIRVVELKFKTKFKRTLLDLLSLFAGRCCQGCLGCLRFCLKEAFFREIENGYADIIISCGASTVATNIFLKYENNAKNIVIMKPGLGRERKMDLIILPTHDAPGKLRSNMVVTESAPNTITEAKVEEAVSRIIGPTLKPANRGVGLLIGGDTKTFKMDRGIIEKVIDGVLRIAEDEKIDLFITTSRRTPAEVDRFLKDNLEKNAKCKMLVIANEKNIEGIVPAIFGLSEVVIVSPDSVSMISEAVSSGKHVVVFKERGYGKTKISENKYEKNIKNLEENGYIKIVAPDEIYDCVKDILEHKPPVKKLEDRKKIIDRLKGIV